MSTFWNMYKAEKKEKKNIFSFSASGTKIKNAKLQDTTKVKRLKEK